MASPIRQEIMLNAAPDEVFAALTQSARFSEVTGQPAEIDAADGGAFSRFGDQVTGRIIEMVPGRRLVEAWRVHGFAIRLGRQTLESTRQRIG